MLMKLDSESPLWFSIAFEHVRKRPVYYEERSIRGKSEKERKKDRAYQHMYNDSCAVRCSCHKRRNLLAEDLLEAETT